MSLTSYRAAPPRGKSMRTIDLRSFIGRGSARLEDLAATYSPVP